jgi:hypothetical protein
MIMGTDVRGLSLGDEAGTQLLGDETNARTTAHRALGDVIGVLGAGAAAAVAENLLLLSDGERAAVVKVLQRGLQINVQRRSGPLLCHTDTQGRARNNEHEERDSADTEASVLVQKET